MLEVTYVRELGVICRDFLCFKVGLCKFLYRNCIIVILFIYYYWFWEVGNFFLSWEVEEKVIEKG